MSLNHAMPHCEDFDIDACPSSCPYGRLTQFLAAHPELLFYPIKWKKATDFDDCKLVYGKCDACEVHYDEGKEARGD